MTIVKTTIGRRSFLKASTLAGGGLMLAFNGLISCTSKTEEEILALPKEWFELNGYLKIGENGVTTIMSPNPEIGQNVKTSMPMIVAEELDADWKNVIVEQAPLNTAIFTRQLAGGSQSIRQGWKGLRTAGATARQMLCEAASKEWKVPVNEITTEAGTLNHKSSGKSATYGEMASAASKIAVPKEVQLKNLKDFNIIGTPRKNVDGKKIVTGQPLYGLDYRKEGMLIAMIAHPPAFGLKLKSVDDSKAKTMPGVKDIFTIKTYQADYSKHMFDVASFPDLVVVVGNTTWEVMNARKALKLEWGQFGDYEETFTHFMTGNKMPKKVPAGLESTTKHTQLMAELSAKPGKVVRKDGNPEQVFKKAAKIIERTYTAPFLAHKTMEPMNFFAYISSAKAQIVMLVHSPEIIESSD